MKHITLLILLFLSVFHAAHAMEKENEQKKLKPIANILKKIKTIQKSLTTQFTTEQPNPPILITKESRIKDAGQACIQAINNNDPEQLEIELLLGADVNYIHNGKSLFYRACEAQKKYADTNILEIIITQDKIDINSRNAQGHTPLHVVCKPGGIPIVKSMLNRSLSAINHQDYNGNTPLHQACKDKRLDLITLLIKKGANTTIQNHEQQTPLYLLFCALGNNNCLHFLDNSDPYISHQLVYTTDHNNNTQLHLCATTLIEDKSQKNLHLEYLLFLIDQNIIDQAAHNNDGKTALDLAREAYEELQNLYQTELLPYIAQALQNQEKILEHFLNFANASTRRNTPIKQQKPHVHPTQETTHYNTTQYKDLSAAQKKCLTGVEKNDLSLVKEGLSEGANINFCNQKGYPLLSQACMSEIKNINIIKELLKHPLNLKATHARSGDTALHAACKANRPAIVELLLLQEPTLATIASIDGTTPLDIAMIHEDTDCLKNILLYNPEVANTINTKNETPLYPAVEKKNNKQIELLLNANNNGINHQNNHGDTVLHKACNRTSYTKEICDIIKLLIIHGADTTIQNNNQATPLINLFSDISRKEFPITDFLLAEHPDIFEILIQIEDSHYNTQFHLCTQLQTFNDNFEHYLSLLKNHKLDIHAKNKDGKTATDLAGELYTKLYNRYTPKKLPYFKRALDTQERIYHTFLRVTALPTSCASFKEIFEPQTTGCPEFPKELVSHIMRAYHDLNIETIVAKKYARNNTYYDDYIENKQAIRQELLKKPEPKLLWSTI